MRCVMGDGGSRKVAVMGSDVVWVVEKRASGVAGRGGEFRRLVEGGGSGVLGRG